MLSINPQKLFDPKPLEPMQVAVLQTLAAVPVGQIVSSDLLIAAMRGAGCKSKQPDLALRTVVTVLRRTLEYGAGIGIINYRNLGYSLYPLRVQHSRAVQ